MSSSLEHSHGLLFGLVSLQNGLIDQDQLVNAFRAWSRNPAQSMADYLVSRGDLEPTQRAAVEVMVAAHLKKHGCDPEKSLAAVGGRRIRNGESKQRA